MDPIQKEDSEESRYSRFIEKNKKSFIESIDKLKQEGEETKEAEEEEKFRTQVYDILKMLGLGIPFAVVPGATAIIPIILKFSSKYGINILPTAFQEKKEE
jgi:hypothetical protein